MKKDISVKIKSRIYDLQARENDDAFFAPENDTAQKIDVECPGVLSFDGKELCVLYKEKNEDMDETETRIFFNTDTPESVNLFRSGAVRSDFCFNTSAGRQTFIYQNDILPFDLSLVTKKLVNRLTADGGTLHLDYKIDIRGANVERTVLDMLVKVVELR